MRPSTTQKSSRGKSSSQLLRSTANLDAAWRQVRANSERSQSAEIREESRAFEKTTSSNLKSIQTRLSRNSFVFKPAKGITIRRKGKKPRPIVVAPVESRIVQRALLNIVQEVSAIKSELTAGFNFGGVPGRGFGVPAAIAKAIRTMRDSGYFIRTDIKSFFVDIPRATAVNAILAHIEDKQFGDVFRKSAETELADMAKLGEDAKLFPLEKTGVAQGSALSPLLCNYLLRDFDRAMNTRGITCIRYIDDFIIFAKNKSIAFKALDGAIAILKELGLEAYNPNNPEHASKAEHGPTSSSIAFLGCEITLKRVRPLRSKYQSLYERVDTIFDDCITALTNPESAAHSTDGRHTFSGAIAAASNVIRGWGNTYSFCNDDQLMRNIDIELDARLANFETRFSSRIKRMSSNDRRRVIGLFLVDDCNKDEDTDSPRFLATAQV